MLRGLQAPLSPHEEITLRRVALGIVLARDLSPADVVRLRNLGLVLDRGEYLGLTAIGKERFSSLSKAPDAPSPQPLDQRIAAFGRSLRAIANNRNSKPK